MIKTLIPSARTVGTGLRLLLAFTLLLGAGYPLLVFGIGRLTPDQADGSLVRHGGQVVGSRLIGQQFTEVKWFQGRPSASDYDAQSSGGTNLSPANPVQQRLIRERAEKYAATNRVGDSSDPDRLVPPDAVTASASGLDPHISLAFATDQIPRIAAARGLPVDKVRAIVDAHTVTQFGRQFVNVLELNLALES